MRKLVWIFLPLIMIAAVSCTPDDITPDEPINNGGSSLADPELSWSTSSCTVTYGVESTFVFPSLNNPYSQAVTYSSSNERVATVSSTGVITVLAQGEATITASTQETDTYKSARVSYKLIVEGNLEQSGISWSADSYTAILASDENVFPTLSNPHNLTVTYKSSNTDVATVNAGGEVKLVATGTVSIIANTAETDKYAAGSASYLLTVKKSADDGIVTTSFESAGDPSSEDDIANTTFTRLVTVTYSGSGASVSGYGDVTDVMKVSVDGNQVTITHTGTECVAYKLTGTATDGFFKLYSSKKQALWLSGLSLNCPSGAAINIQSGKRTFVYVEGTNTLSDGTSASYASGDEDMKAVFFSEGQLVFSGSGSLKVTANNAVEKSCISSDDYVRILNNPSITVSTGSKAGHGIRGKEYVQLSGGLTSIASAGAMKKGITSEDYVLVEGGTHTINVTGNLAYDSTDKEYKGTAGIKADNYFGMTGGTVTIKNSGTGGKGIRAGSEEYSGTLSASYISGGTLNISTTGSESNDVSCKGMKIGWATKSGNKVTAYAGELNIRGGTVIVNAEKSEGIEVKGNIVISGSAQVYVISRGDDAINGQAEIDVTGGYVYAYSTANDAIDANHDLKISGGYVFAITTRGNPEVALDANSEERYKLYITGGTVVAYGGLESGYSSTNTVYTMSCTAGSWNALHNGSSYIAAFKAPSGVSSVAVCSSGLSKGYKGVIVGSTTYANDVWATSSISGGTAVSLSPYSGSSGPGGRH